MKFNAALNLFLAIAIESTIKQLSIEQFVEQCKEENLDPLQEILSVEADSEFDKNYRALKEMIEKENEQAELAMIESEEYQEAVIMGDDVSIFVAPKRELTTEDLLTIEGFVLQNEDTLSSVARMFSEQLLLTTFEKFIESGHLELFQNNRYMRYNELRAQDRLKIGKLLDFSATTQHEFVAEFIKKATQAFSNGETETERLWSFVDYISFIQEGLDQL